MRPARLVFLCSVSIALLVSPSIASVRVAPTDSAQWAPVIAGDRAGGAYLAWVDGRSRPGTTWMQRIDSDARPHAAWPAAGLEALSYPGQTLPVLLVDDSGSGVYVASGGDGWHPKEWVSIARVRADAAPASGWPAGGLLIYDTVIESPGAIAETPLGVSGQGMVTLFPTLAQGEDDDALLAYGYMSFRGDLNLRVGRMAVAGTGFVGPWPAAPCNGYNTRIPTALADGSGGMYILSRTGSGLLMLNRIQSDGTPHPAWPACGMPVVPDRLGQFAPALVPAPEGGVYAVWQDERDPAVTRTYVQRFTANALVSSGWPGRGFAVSPGMSEVGVARPAMGLEYTYSSAVSDGAGGVYIAWTDVQAGEGDIYLQRVAPNGKPAPGWPWGGLAVSVAGGAQAHPSIASDGANGAFLAWDDARRGAGRDIYAQHVLADGSIAPGWAIDGELVDGHFADQHSPVIVAGSDGEPIVAWVDTRHDAPNIYAGRRAALGERTAAGRRPGIRPPGDPAPAADLGIDVQTMPLGVPPGIRLTIGGQGVAEASIHDVTGRELLRREFQPGEHQLVLEGLEFAPGVYFARLTRGEARATSRIVLWK